MIPPLEKEHKEILELAERLHREQGVAYSTMTMRAIGNGEILDRIREGGDMGIRTYHKLKRWFKAELRK